MNQQIEVITGETRRESSKKVPFGNIFFIGCFLAYCVLFSAFIHSMTANDDLPTENKPGLLKCVDLGIAHWDLSKSRTTEFEFNEP